MEQFKQHTVALLILDGRLQVETLRQTGQRQRRRIAHTAGAALGFCLCPNAQLRMVANAALDNFSCVAQPITISKTDYIQIC